MSFQISLIGVFPDFLSQWAQCGMARRAIESERLSINTISLLDYGVGKHRKIDDTPYGGGPGLILRYDVILSALQDTKQRFGDGYVIMMDAAGQSFHDQSARRLADEQSHLIFIAGRYEGVDARIYEHVDELISVGDYILTGGEPAAVIISDAVIRYRSGVLGNAASAESDSHGGHDVEYRQYTKPESHAGLGVPQVLLSGHHQRIAEARAIDAGARKESVKSLSGSPLSPRVVSDVQVEKENL